MPMPVTIRRAEPRDLPEIQALLHAFGQHLERPEWVTGSAGALEAALFGDPPSGHGHVAELDGRVVGIALWFLTYNFWTTRPVLYLEDLYVDASARGSGAGEALLRALGAEAVARDCAWMSWAVLVTNQGAKRFYERLGAAHDPSWEVWRLEGDTLTALGTGRN
ncbi:GNAT family N-acetyltransferase [Sphingomonas sp. SFZ2018-12]|nr:GNAT family N-acetyltransferase [Sphingomonas sp. SFZ2018-12]